MQNIQLNPALWLGLPCLVCFSLIGLELTLQEASIQNLYAESGIMELLQVFILVAAFALIIPLLKKKYAKEHFYIKPFLFLCLVACFYIIGEEISWGQNFFHWGTPESWKEINNQDELNLHNTSRWLNHIPRYGLMIAIGIAGLILPILRFLKIDIVPKSLQLITNTNSLFTTSVLLLFIGLGNKLHKVFFDEKLFFRASEIEEIFIYLFIFLYVLILRKKIAQENYIG